MKSRPILPSTIAALLALAITARAQTWDGGGADNNFTTANNWNPNAIPANNGTANLVFGGNLRTAPFVNVNFDVSSVSFNNTAAQFAIGASGGSVLTVRGGGITNNDDNTQHFSTPVTFAAGSMITASSGDLDFTGQINIGGNSVTVNGAFNTYLGRIAGTGGLMKNGIGTLGISPFGVAQNYALTISFGAVNYTSDVSFVGPAAAIAVNVGSLVLDGNLSVSSGATLAVQNTAMFTLAANRSLLVQSGSSATFVASLITPANSFYSVTTNSSLSTGGLTVRDGASIEVLANSSFTATAGSFQLGQAGTSGSMLVDGQGSSLTSFAGTSAYLGNGANSTGTLTFSNGATGSFGASTLRLAPSLASTATLTVKSGARVTAGTLDVAATVGTGTATVLVTGPGSELNATSTASAFTIGAANTSAGAVTVADGAELNLSTPLTINETGTLTLNGGTISLAFSNAFINHGVFNFNSGRISLGEKLSIGGDSADIAPLGRNITLPAGKEIVVPSTRTTTIETGGVLVLDGGLLSTGSLANTGGTFDFRRGTLRLTGTASFDINPTGPLGANVALPAGSTLAATATTSIAADGVLTLDGGSFSTATLSNSGNVVINAGTATLNTGTNASGAQMIVARNLAISGNFTNSHGARLELAGGTGRITGANTLLNDGLFTGSGTITKAVSNNATGEIRADTGRTLSFTGAFSPNQGQLNLQGGTLDFTGPVTNSAGASIVGRGALRTGGLTNEGAMNFSAGTTDIYGAVTQTGGAAGNARVISSGGGTVTFYDDFVHNGKEVRASAGCAIVFFGDVTGAGPYTGTGAIYYEGTFSPGMSPAAVSFEGDMAFGEGATLTMELGGPLAGTQYDRVNIAGTLFEDGALEVALYGGFVPHLGDMFDLFDAGTIAGSFDGVNLPALSGDLDWDATNLRTTGQLRVVPEPGIGALLLSSLTLGAFRRRR